MIFSLLLAALPLLPMYTETLFIAEYPGETNEFIPVFREMKKQGKSFHILALGPAKGLISQEEFSKELLFIEETSDIPAQVFAKNVITGVHSAKQAELLEAFAKKGSRTIAYWDNPEPRGAAPYFETALKVQKHAKILFAPCKYVASAPEFSDREKTSIRVVGKPSLEIWQKEIETISQEQVLAKTSFSKGVPVLTFVGTYGENYEKAFSLLIDALNASSVKQIIFQIHPASKGDFEPSACKKLKSSIRYAIAGKNAPIQLTMAESMSVASKVMTYNSSAGFQAFFSGKEVAYVLPKDDLFTTSLLETGLAVKVSSANDLDHFLLQEKVSDPAQFFHKMGFPENSPELFIQAIEENDL